MNDKCKYCDYVSKCSRICEYDSYLCKIHRSFPKVVDKSYEQLQQENKYLDEVNCKLRKTNEQLKDNWNELKKWLRIKDILANSKINPQSIKFKDLLKHMEYLEKSDNNV